MKRRCPATKFRLKSGHEARWGRREFILFHENKDGGSIRTDAVDMGSGDDPQVLSEAEMRRRERQHRLAALKKSKWKSYGAGGGGRNFKKSNPPPWRRR
jgi:hypothetical protein